MAFSREKFTAAVRAERVGPKTRFQPNTRSCDGSWWSSEQQVTLSFKLPHVVLDPWFPAVTTVPYSRFPLECLRVIYHHLMQLPRVR